MNILLFIKLTIKLILFIKLTIKLISSVQKNILNVFLK